MTPSTEALPYFSIVIPSYNRIRFLPETIDSILKQTCQDFEILVVDDGSTDHTPEIIRNRYNQFPNLRLIEQVIPNGVPPGITDSGSLKENM